MPKTINEAINFSEGSDSDDMDVPTEPEMEYVPAQKPMDNNGSEMDVMAFIDDIRKKSLKGMAQLADNPEDSVTKSLNPMLLLHNLTNNRCSRACNFSTHQTKQINPASVARQDFSFLYSHVIIPAFSKHTSIIRNPKSGHIQAHPPSDSPSYP